jgi:hypothetical protein
MRQVALAPQSEAAMASAADDLPDLGRCQWLELVI